MENKVINIGLVVEVAKGLKELCDKVVFVGGAVISLYVDDEAADEIRPTFDIDMTIKLAGFPDWVKIQERLIELKFSPDPDGQAICSYLYKGISVDILPTENSYIGESNSWYEPGLKNVKEIDIENETIKIFTAPYFLATKFEAFQGRGGGDYRISHDFEDIIYIIDNRTSIVEEILGADKKVNAFLKQQFNEVAKNAHSEEIIRAQIHPLMFDSRYPILLDKIMQIIEG